MSPHFYEFINSFVVLIPSGKYSAKQFIVHTLTHHQTSYIHHSVKVTKFILQQMK